MRPRVRTIAVLILCLALFTGPALAVEINGTVEVDAPDGPKVAITASNGGDLVLDGPDGPSRVNVTHDAGSAVFSSQNPTEVAVKTDELVGTYSRATQISAGPTALTISPADKEPIIVSGGLESIAWTDAISDDSTTDFNYTASSTASVTISTSTADSTLVALDQSTGAVLDSASSNATGVVTFSSLPSGTHSVVINTPAAPVLSDPKPADGVTVTETPINISINVSDADFNRSYGDSVEVTFYDASDGSTIGSETLQSDGTANVTWDSGFLGGVNQWYAVASDNYGKSTTSQTYSLFGPDVIQIRDEESQELLDDLNGNISVQFYPSNDSRSTIYTRQAQGGVVSLEGLPADEEFVVVADVDGYESRRIVINSVIEQSTIYLVNESNSLLVLNEFSLIDDSGQFPTPQTKLFIQKAFETQDGNAEYRTITGDYFGASDRYPAVLIRSERYRLVIENQEGQRRTLGAYTPETDQSVPLQIGEITWPQPDTEAWKLSSSFDEDSNVAKVQYNDPAGKTSQLDLTIYERGNESNVLYEETVSDPTQYQTSVQLTANQSQSEWMIDYSVVRSGETTTNTVPLGNDNGVVVPFDKKWLGVFGMLAAIILMAAFPGPLSAIGGIVTVSVVGILILFGWTSIPISSWFVAASIAVLGLIKSKEETTI